MKLLIGRTSKTTEGKIINYSTFEMSDSDILDAIILFQTSQSGIPDTYIEELSIEEVTI